MEFMQPVPAVPLVSDHASSAAHTRSPAETFSIARVMPVSPLEGLGWDGWVGVDGRIHRVKMGPPGVCWQMLFNLFQPQLTDVVMPIISIPDSTQAMLI